MCERDFDDTDQCPIIHRYSFGPEPEPEVDPLYDPDEDVDYGFILWSIYHYPRVDD